MAVLPIRVYPDEILRKQCKDITTIGDEEQRLFDDMVETMLENKGVGLAAPQVGILKNVIVAAPKGTKDETYVFVNPVITKTKGEATDTEGCLSIPCASAEITRAKKIWVEALDRDGKKIRFTATDFFARIIQHETDHLGGKLFFDHLGYSARKEVINCARKVNKL